MASVAKVVFPRGVHEVGHDMLTSRASRWSRQEVWTARTASSSHRQHPVPMFLAFMGSCGSALCLEQRCRRLEETSRFRRWRGKRRRHYIALAAKSRGEEATPDYACFSDDLILVLSQAEKKAKELKQAQVGTEALLLGLLTAEVCPGAEATRSAAFPGIEAAAVAAYVTQRTGGSKGAPPGGGPLVFTPMTRRVVRHAEEEKTLLGHQAVEPAHLLLALLKEEQGESHWLLDHFEQDREEVRRRVLQTLQGALAIVRLNAAKKIAELKRASAQSAASSSEESKDSAMSPLAARLSQAFETLTEGLVERTVEAKLLLLAALSGEHLFLLGPPGTAKSLLARRLATVCRGEFFERLLTRFSVPEEMFGPLSLRALENDELRRKVEGFLPTADVAFLDEVFKANSSILNALLTLLNERIFDNGGERIDVPLWCAVAASNELPESDELEALFDRFLLRRAVPRVSDAQVPFFLRCSLDANAAAYEEAASSSQKMEDVPRLSARDSEEARRLAAESVKFPDRLLDLIVGLRAYLRDEAEPPVRLSDRRMGKAVRLIRLAAFAAGSNEVSELDLLLLQHMCWDKEPSQAGEVRVWLLERMRNAHNDDSEKDVVDQARYFLDGIRTRLQTRRHTSTEVNRGRKDIAALRTPLEDGLRTRLARLQQLKRQFSGALDQRLFWLEAEDIEEARNVLIPTAEQAVQRAEECLIEVLELQGALEINEAEARKLCLESLLGDFDGGQDLQDSLDKVNRMASRRMPRDLPLLDSSP